MGIDTSAALVRNIFGRAIDLGRKYGRSKNKADLYEALRLLGTGCHCLEDYSAHSNYVELALIEMGERDIFPHTGRNTAVRLRGARNEVYPIVTGTFGGVDFLHSVCGEFGDKATQSEIQELEGALNAAEKSDGSALRDLLSKIPSGLFGGKDEAGKVDELQQNAQAHQMQNTKISPRQPEEWTRYLQDVQKQIYPIIQWHDEVMQGLTETIEKIPMLPELIENVQEEINKFVFSLLAPYVVPIIRQINNELETGSSEIIQSSKQQQHIVFNDDRSSDPTHSMLSKDHFSNVLNEPAGRIASATIKWVVPQLVEAWDDERVDIGRTLDRIINGVLHHPALRDQGGDAAEGRRVMFGVVEQWWRQKDEREKSSLRQQLSRRGVENGENHKEGVHDHGHGSYRPQGQGFGIAGVTGGSGGGKSSYPIGQTFGAIENLVQGGGQSGRPQQGYGGGNQTSNKIGQAAGEAVGGGLLGSLVGGIASAVGADMLGGGLDQKKETYKRDSYGREGQHTETITQMGQSQSGNRYGQAQYSRTDEPSGGRSEQYTRYEQHPGGATVHTEKRDSHGQYSEQTKTYSSQTSYGRTEQHSSSGGYGSRKDDESDEEKRRKKEKKKYGGGRDDSDDDNKPKYGSSHSRRKSKDNDSDDDKRGKYGSSGYGGRKNDDSDEEKRRKKEKKYGRDDDSDDDKKSRKQSGYGSGGRQQEPSYGRQTESSYGHQQESSYGRQQETTSYGSVRRDDDDNRGSSYGRSGQASSGYGSSQRQDYDSMPGGFGNEDNRGSAGYGSQQQQSYGSGGGYGRSDNTSSGYGGGRQEQSSRGYGAQQSSYGGRQESGGYGSQQDSYGSGRQDQGGYGQEQQSYGQTGGYGRRDDDDDSNRGSGNQGYGSGGGYGQGSSGGYGDNSGSGYGGSRY